MKVRCGMCVNELNKKCNVKKTTIKLNKSRRCEDYKLDESKEIARLEQRARVMDQQEAAVKHSNVAYPMTGDLSRFKTTATK